MPIYSTRAHCFCGRSVRARLWIRRVIVLRSDKVFFARGSLSPSLCRTDWWRPSVDRAKAWRIALLIAGSERLSAVLGCFQNSETDLAPVGATTSGYFFRL